MPGKEGEARIAMLEPPMHNEQLNRAGIVMLDLPMLGDSFVTRYAQHSFAIAEPSDSASDLVARMCKHRATPFRPKKVALDPTDVARSPSLAERRSAPTPACHTGKKKSVFGSSSQAIRREQCLTDLFASDGFVVARDGSGVIWVSLFQSTQHMMEASVGPAGTVLSTFYLLELTPIETVSSVEVKMARHLFGGRAVLCAEKLEQALLQGLQAAGARAVLCPRPAGAEMCAAAQHREAAVEGVHSLVRQLRGGVGIAEAVENNGFWEMQPFNPGPEPP
jgi:hypothetical protein